MLRHGWLKIDGVQTGDRTVEEQVHALKPALEECAGKTVLDLGCAEGLIALAFCQAGAARALGLDSKASHLRIARELCRGQPIAFEDYNMELAELRTPVAFDIVLALGIIHKLTFPESGLRFAARSARSLLLLRSGRGADAAGIISGKHSGNKCDSRAVLSGYGFTLERVIVGPRPHREPVEYWRKT